MKTCIKYNSIEQLQYLITANLVNSYTRGDFVEIEHNGKRTWAIIAESEWDVTAGMYVLTAYASINWHYSEPAVEYNSMLATTLTMVNDIRVGRHLLKCGFDAPGYNRLVVTRLDAEQACLFYDLLASANKFFDQYICTLISLDKLSQYLCIIGDDCIEQMQARQQLIML